MEDTILYKKCEAFALRIVKLCGKLKEYNIAKKIFKCGTSIAAYLSSNIYGEGLDFRSNAKMAIKEASEAKFWLRMLFSGEYINKYDYDSLTTDVNELIKMLTEAISG